MRDGEASPVIRWRRSTWRSRMVVFVVLGATLLYLAWLEFGPDGSEPPFWLGLAVAFGAFGLRRVIRRWQVEVISPRPQTAEHKRAYRRLQVFQYSFLAGCFIPFMWMMIAPEHSRARAIAGIVTAVTFVAWIATQPLFVAAYERLFRDVARAEGAYGF